MGGVIRPRVTSRTAVRIGRFLGEKHLAPHAVATILKAKDWAKSIQSGTPQLAGESPAAPESACGLIEQIAEDLIGSAVGIERQLLSKSLQETLFYCLKFETDLTAAQIKSRLERFLARHTEAGFIRLFLSLHFFNCIWFYTEEWFSDEASSEVTSDVLESDMHELEKVCRRAVIGASRHIDVVDKLAAEELIRDIEQRLASFCRTTAGSTHLAAKNPGVIQTFIRFQSSR